MKLKNFVIRTGIVIALLVLTCQYSRADIIPGAHVFYTYQDPNNVYSFAAQSKDLTTQFTNTWGFSYPRQYAPAVFSSTSTMSLLPSPSLSLETVGKNLAPQYYESNEIYSAADSAGYVYSFMISSPQTTLVDISIDYAVSVAIEGHAQAIVQIGMGLTMGNYGSGITDFNMLNISKFEDWTSGPMTFYTSPDSNNSNPIYTNTVYDVVMKAAGLNYSGDSKVSIFIDPTISIETPGDFTLLTSFGVGNGPTTATPEPGTMLLMGIGAAGAAFMRRRAKRS